MRTKITGSKGIDLEILENGVMPIVEYPAPPIDNLQVMRPFRQYLTATGEPSGSRDMRVNGSVTPIPFYVKSSQTHDRYISTISFVIADAGATLNNFGNLAALVNGCRLSYFADEGEIVIEDSLKSNFDFVFLCGGQPAFGDAAGSFRANNVVGTAEGYLPILDFEKMFRFRWGLRIKNASNQKVQLLIRDAISAVLVDGFYSVVSGFERSIE